MESYIFLLAGFYLGFLMLGSFFYFTTARVNSLKWSTGNKALKFFRFCMYVVLLPIGMTLVATLYLVYAGHIDIL